jgi:cytochrome c
MMTNESHAIRENTIMRSIVIAALYFGISGCAALAQDVAAGETSFRKCAPCHAVGDGATNKVGPELNGLDGRKAGAVDGYNYSDANKNSGITWNEGTFKEYIKDPRAKVPGTKMVFAGIKNDKEIDDLWSYLRQFAADGQKK